MNIVTRRIPLHFVHGEKYPDPAVLDILFQRAGNFGERPPAEEGSGIKVGWVVPQIMASPKSVSSPFLEAIKLLGLNLCPILDPPNCMLRGENIAPFLEAVSKHVDVVVVASNMHTALHARVAGTLTIPLINAEYVAGLIKERQKWVPSTDPTQVWRVLLEIALHLLPDDNA